MTGLAPTLQAFFTERLVRQRRASPHTIVAYRDTMRMLLTFATEQTKVAPSQLDLDHLDAPLIAAFLDHLENDRGNSVRTRNARLAAIHSLLRFAAPRHPEHAASIARALAIPSKRCHRALVTYLTDPEVEALLGACDQQTWTGRRDHALLLLAVQTGLRISELIGLTCRDVHLGAGAHVACHGKGRKDRITPLTATTIASLKTWTTERAGEPSDALFPTRQGQPLSRDAIEHRIALYTSKGAQSCPSLLRKQTSAHTLRHTAAMRLLHAGVDTSVIALWLGHEQVDTTQIYLHADLTIKEAAIARTRPPGSRTARYRPPDSILSWLDQL